MSYYQRVIDGRTDGQTDRRTDTPPMPTSRSEIAERDTKMSRYIEKLHKYTLNVSLVGGICTETLHNLIIDLNSNFNFIARLL